MGCSRMAQWEEIKVTQGTGLLLQMVANASRRRNNSFNQHLYLKTGGNGLHGLSQPQLEFPLAEIPVFSLAAGLHVQLKEGPGFR